jgi:hypothetical protein
MVFVKGRQIEKLPFERLVDVLEIEVRKLI